MPGLAPTAILGAQCRHDPVAHASKHRFVRPLRVGHKVMQRLVLGSDMQGIHVRRQRFHALSLDRQHQTSTVVHQPGIPVRMAQHLAQILKIAFNFSKLFHFASFTRPGGLVLGKKWIYLTQCK